MPQASCPASAAVARAGDVVENPGDLRGAEIGIEQQPGLRLDHRLAAVGAELVADAGRAAILPDDRAVDRLAGRAVPDDDRLALVGDADGGDVGRLQAWPSCSASTATASCVDQISSGSCSTQPGCGKAAGTRAGRGRRFRRARRRRSPATKSCLDRRPGYASWRRLRAEMSADRTRPNDDAAAPCDVIALPSTRCHAAGYRVRKQPAARTAPMSYIIAHRGASFDAPENTLAAFRLAWEQGADGIEGDFMLTADGQIVCFHDLDTQRVTGEKRDRQGDDARRAAVARRRPLEGRALARRADRVARRSARGDPRGQEIRRASSKTGRRSSSRSAEMLARVGYLQRRNLDHQPGRRDDRRMQAAAAAYQVALAQRLQAGRARQLAADGGRSDRHDQRVGAAGFGSLAMPEHFDAEFVQKLRAAGIEEFHVWTVDDPEVARFYAELGAWGITTNRPGIHSE